MKPRRIFVVGGGGALGTAVLEQLLAHPGIDAVSVLARAPLQTALRGLQAVAEVSASGADTALVVFDRQRHANGREAAFVRPEPSALPAIAQGLRDSGVQTLIVVVPHAPALLPEALRAGLATLDEAAVSAMGFQHLVFMRMAQAGSADAGAVASFGHRLARAMLSQLHWMIPQREQPVRSAVVARIAAALVQALPGSAVGVRVLPQQLSWLAAQGLDPQALVTDWLAGRALPPAPAAGRGRSALGAPR